MLCAGAMCASFPSPACAWHTGWRTTEQRPAGVPRQPQLCPAPGLPAHCLDTEELRLLSLKAHTGRAAMLREMSADAAETSMWLFIEAITVSPVAVWVSLALPGQMLVQALSHLKSTPALKGWLGCLSLVGPLARAEKLLG